MFVAVGFVSLFGVSLLGFPGPGMVRGCVVRVGPLEDGGGSGLFDAPAGLPAVDCGCN